MFSVSMPSSESTQIFKQGSDKPDNDDSLNRYVLMDPNAQMKSDKCYKILWKVLEIASLVAFTALAVVATIWTGIVAPIYLPVTSVIFITLLPVAFKIYSFLHYKSMENEIEEFVEQSVCDQLAKLPKSEKKFIEYLDKLGAKTPESHSAKTLKWVAARYESLEDASKKTEKKIAKIEKKLADPEKAENLQKNRFKILQLREAAQVHKIQAAYYLGVLRNPYDQRDLSDLCQMNFDIPFPDQTVIVNRLIAEKFNDEKANVVIVFGADEKGTTIEELQKMTTSEVSERLFKKAESKEESKEESA